MVKKIGVLCHVSSLESKYGVGDFGKSAFEFIDFLSDNNINIWQILPLNKTNIYNCPYASMCYFSIDEMFLDVDEFVDKKYIDKSDLTLLKDASRSKKVNYSIVKQEKIKLFKKAYLKITKNELKDINNYLKKHPEIYDYAVFLELISQFNCSWQKLPKYYLNKGSKEYIQFEMDNKNQIMYHVFVQYILFNQWQKVMAYAKSKNVQILGDLPIYPSPDSFDVYNNRNKFKINQKTYKPLVYGGVPGDQFNPNGQNWGTCVYNWQNLEIEDYKFLIDKIISTKKYYNILRLDHFLGYVYHYEHSATGGKNKWHSDGGEDFFDKLKCQINFNSIVVEDLGLNIELANNIIKKFNLRGMSVLQMAMGENIKFLPQNVNKNTIYYLGTHDNNTYLGYINGLSNKERKELCKLLDIDFTTNVDLCLKSMKKMLESQANMVVFQIQDLLLQNQNYRMNVPGRAEDCWEYKLPKNYKNKAKDVLSQLIY